MSNLKENMLYKLERCFRSTHNVPLFSGHPVYRIFSYWNS